jgi:hypothetical protein
MRAFFGTLIKIESRPIFSNLHDDLSSGAAAACIYCVNHQYLKKFSYGFWDNQWFGRNQIYLKLKLGAMQFMPGIKNLNLIFF